MSADFGNEMGYGRWGWFVGLLYIVQMSPLCTQRTVDL
jgi:hypothetical protein